MYWSKDEVTFHHRNLKAIKPHVEGINMTFGKDVQIGRVMSLSKSVVGKVCYSNLSRTTLLVWVNLHWKPLLDYFPRVHLLVDNWICFHSVSEELVTCILSRPWVVCRGSCA